MDDKCTSGVVAGASAELRRRAWVESTGSSTHSREGASSVKRWLAISAAVVAVVLAATALWLFGPFGDPDLSATPNPAADYAAGVARIRAVQKADSSPGIAERGRSIALLHGAHTDKAVVILHGYTSCPKQFRRVAQGYYEAGYNVWVPRAPMHGYADYLTPAQSRIKAGALRDYADDAIDVGVGLGDEVTVVGLSGGGALTLWSLAERPEVARAVAISPFLHPRSVPVWQMRPLGRLTSVGLLRGMYRWWDPVLKGSPERQRIDPNVYPRGSVSAMMQYLTIGRWLRDTRAKDGPPAGSLTLVVNEHDPDIDAAVQRRHRPHADA